MAKKTVGERIIDRLDKWYDNSPLQVIANSSPEDLREESRIRKIKTACYVGAGAVSIAGIELTDGVVEKLSIGGLVVSGWMAWNHASHALLYQAHANTAEQVGDEMLQQHPEDQANNY